MLLWRAVLSEHFHIAAIRRVAVEHALGPHDFGHRLKQRRDLDIGEARTPGRVLLGQKQVPQLFRLGFITDVVVPRWYLPEMLRVMTPLVPLTLARVNMLVHEILQLCIQCTNLIAYLKTHTMFPLLLLMSTAVCSFTPTISLSAPVERCAALIRHYGLA